VKRNTDFPARIGKTESCEGKIKKRGGGVIRQKRLGLRRGKLKKDLNSEKGGEGKKGGGKGGAREIHGVKKGGSGELGV